MVNEDNNFPPQGITYTECDSSNDADTLSVGGIVYLGKGWRVQMGFYSDESSNWMWSDWSTFSIVKASSV